METVKITLHDQLGAALGEVWDLAVSSVAEAINAIETLTDGKLSDFLLKKDKKGAKYRVLINGDDFVSEKPLETLEDAKYAKDSNLVIKIKNLKTIDIIPVHEGASSVLNIILGAILIIVGVILIIAGGSGALLIAVGIGLLAVGIVGLLSKPPQGEDFRGNTKLSYLFGGPENVTNEGGPVPLGYGRLLVGSQVVAASYNIFDVSADNPTSNVPVTTGGREGNGSGQKPTPNG